MKRHLIALVLSTVTFASVADDKVLLGIVEEPQCKKQPEMVVRPLFANSNGKWIALNSSSRARTFLSKEVSWFVVAGGKSRQRLSSVDVGIKPDPEWTYPRDFWHLPKLADDLKATPNTSGLFVGWCDAPKIRPFALTTRGGVSDPELWSSSTLPMPSSTQLAQAFRRSLKGTRLCLDGDKPRPYQLNSRDISVTTRVVSTKGISLVELRLKRNTIECQSERGDALGSRWFVLDQTTIRYLGSDLSLVEIADYDKDGASEALFWFSGYNNDGYSLFSEGLRTRTDFLWNYH